ncbi:MAG TPA: hypothetical protein VGK20_03020 [Candidatus Binatia bacterium]|jgi:hypothetical protein
MGTPQRLTAYFGRLTNGRVILWSYLIWYLVTVATHFDPRPRLWLTSLGLSAIIGTALVISTRSSATGSTDLDRWQVLRLYLMPFCVSSFAALVKDAGYVLVFPPSLALNAAAFSLIVAFVALVLGLRRARTDPALSQQNVDPERQRAV